MHDKDDEAAVSADLDADASSRRGGEAEDRDADRETLRKDGDAQRRAMREAGFGDDKGGDIS